MQEISRERIDALIAATDWHGARRALNQFWQESVGPASAAFVVGRYEKLRAHIELLPCRVAILRSFTVEPVVPLLRAAAYIAGINLEVCPGDFNTYTQDILDPNSWLYVFQPHLVIIALQTRDIVPSLWDSFADLDEAATQIVVDQTLGMFQQLVRSFRGQSTAHLVIHSLELPATPSLGLLDGRNEFGQTTSLHTINNGLSVLTRSAENVYLLDYNGLIARRGNSAWHDERKWLMARMPIAAGELIHLAREWMRFIHPITGRICKVLAVDLDNTLWGGVIGEEGIDGIKLGHEYPGAAFSSLQRVILDLYRRGIILALCSKNNLFEAMEAIQNHPAMLLRPQHFAAVRINWVDKATNLREIAAELNVGIDSVAFLDDNPVEREWIRGQIPEVTVIELPRDPMLYAKTLRESPAFERLELTDEDKSRGRFYAGQRMRSELQQGTSSLEDFYRSLQMKARVEPVNDHTLTRAAQLTQKTNQFNLTTRRYTEQQLGELLTLPEARAFTIQLSDRFGDNGIVGLAIIRQQAEVAEIDSFLLSCRVIGRTVETAFLATLTRDAKHHGVTKLTGLFMPTKKNAPCADFYKQHEFTRVGERDGASMWELTLSGTPLVCPPWIEIQSPNAFDPKELIHE